jgi:hypothetical protein
MVRYYAFVRESTAARHRIDLDSVCYLSQLRTIDEEHGLKPGDLIVLPSDKSNGQVKQLKRGNSGYRWLKVKGD